MKKLKKIVKDIVSGGERPADEMKALVWQLICYSPKMPLRLPQEQLLAGAKTFTLAVNDDHFEKRALKFHGFKWGNGRRKILITHGWGSKAADLADIINALLTVNNVQVIAFDAPGNGSSEGELSNLVLYVLSVKAVIAAYGEPDILIGHSLGAMANIMAAADLQLSPQILISIAPLVRLKENFESTMLNVGIAADGRQAFFYSFEQEFGLPASFYDLNNLYPDRPLRHWLAYDELDMISTYDFLKEFLAGHLSVQSQNYQGAGHERIIRSETMISDLLAEVQLALSGC